jgi:hypothetical protein
MAATRSRSFCPYTLASVLFLPNVGLRNIGYSRNIGCPRKMCAAMRCRHLGGARSTKTALDWAGDRVRASLRRFVCCALSVRALARPDAVRRSESKRASAHSRMRASCHARVLSAAVREATSFCNGAPSNCACRRTAHLPRGAAAGGSGSPEAFIPARLIVSDHRCSGSPARIRSSAHSLKRACYQQSPAA